MVPGANAILNGSDPRLFLLLFQNSPLFFTLFCLSFLFVIYKKFEQIVSSEHRNSINLSQNLKLKAIAYIIMVASAFGFIVDSSAGFPYGLISIACLSIVFFAFFKLIGFKK